MEFLFSDPVKVDAPADFELLPYSYCEKSVGEVFREIAGKFPKNIALIDPQQRVTYLELNSKVNQVAHALVSRSLPAPAVVAFLLDRNIDAITVILAILKAGLIYMALDPLNPSEYLQTILNDAQPDLIITNGQYLPLAQKLAQDRLQLLNLDELKTSLTGSEPKARVSSDQLAAIFYTSGTAGQPKGVVMDHRALIHRTWVHLNLHRMNPHDRSPLPFPFSFAWSITPIFSSLFCGGTGFPCNYAEMQLDDLADWVDRNQLTIIHIPPNLVRQLLASLPEGRRFKSVRLTNVGSDALYPKDLTLWKQHANPGSILAYGLASSEFGTITRKFFNHQYESASDRLPVGYPVPSIKIKILNENGHPVRGNEVGEVAVQSLSSIRGYWNKTEVARPLDKHEENFRLTGDMGRLLPDGALEYHGRVDTVVKIRGYRVDTTEIVLALGGHPAIKECFVTTKPLPHAPENMRIVAWVALRSGQAATVHDLRTFLRERFPLYKIPSRFVFLEALPRTSHGKVDVNALPEPPVRIDTSSHAPGNSTEELIAHIWRDLLGLEFVGVEDNFFDLGGDSLMSLSMTLEVERQTGKTVNSSFFQQPTISHLAESLGQQDQGSPNALNIKPTGGKPALAASALFANPLRKKKRRLQLAKILNLNIWSDYLIRLSPVILRKTILPRTYAEGNRWLMEWCTRPEARHGIYHSKAKLLQTLAANLENCTYDAETLFSLSLFGTMHRFMQRYSLWHEHSIDFEMLRTSSHPYWQSLYHLVNQGTAVEIDEFFPISGLENAEKAIREKRGIIFLSYHNSMDRLGSYLLQHRLQEGKIEAISTVHAEKVSPYWQMIQAGKANKNIVAGLHAGAANQGQRTLAEGGLVKMIPDQSFEHGPNMYRASVAGREYFLKTGFAELALVTGAKVIPYLFSILPGGQINTTLLPPLEVQGDDHQAQVKSLMEQYAAFLTTCWNTSPETFFWANISKHLNLPIFSES